MPRFRAYAAALAMGAAPLAAPPPPVTPPIDGATLFMGDSIMVGTPPFVKVNGETFTLAIGGKTSSWLLGALREFAATGALTRFRNMVFLIGTNDISWALTAPQIAQNITELIAIGHGHGMTVYACTIPPTKGYPSYDARADVTPKRRAVNASIRASMADKVIDLDVLTADPSDPERLAPAYDGGDHLHLRKDKLAALLQREVTSPPRAAPTPNAAKGAGLMLGIAAGVVVAIVVLRKGW